MAVATGKDMCIMAKLPPRPEGPIPTQEEVDKLRESLQKLPDGVLTPEERALLLTAIDRFSAMRKVLKVCRNPLGRLRAILRGEEDGGKPLVVVPTKQEVDTRAQRDS